MTFTIKDFNVCSVNINVLCKQCQHYYSQMNSYHHGNLKKELLDCALKMCERDGILNSVLGHLPKKAMFLRPHHIDTLKQKKISMLKLQ